MSENVQFDEDQVGMPKASVGHSAPTSFAAAQFTQQQQPTGMVGWLVRHGIISSDSGAKVILGLFICVNFILAGVVLYFFVLK